MTPARSTVLQRVVFHLHSCLSKGEIVEESSFLIDRVTNTPREVDVILRTRVADHEVIVGIEVREQVRKATVEWVEQMAAKHASLPTSKLVLISRAGFSKAALSKAAALGIDAHSIAEAETSDWSTLFGDGGKPDLELWAFRILGCGVVLGPPINAEVPAPPELPLSNAVGEYRCTLEELVRPRTDGDPEFTDKVIKRMKESGGRRIGAALTFRPPVFIRDVADELHEILKICVYVEAFNTGDDVHFTAARYRTTAMAYGTGTIPMGDYSISVVKNDDGKTEGAMSLRDRTSGEVRTAPVRFPEDAGKLAFLTDLFHIPDDGERKEHPPSWGPESDCS